MPSPLPGMDPDLESPDFWPEVHSQLIVAMANSLAPQLPPRYYAAIEQRTYMDTPEDSIPVGIPDVSVSRRESERVPERGLERGTVAALPQAEVVTLPVPEEVTERYLEIRDTQTAAVMTAVEILSPKNKRAGEVRTAYLRKRQRVLASQTHLVEVDLLRGQVPMPVGATGKTDYRILVSRAEWRPRALLYGFDLRQEIPVFGVPLGMGEEEPLADVKGLGWGVRAGQVWVLGGLWEGGAA